jgi:bacillithiol biosynthesis cysteine-adding enzyme BshC
VASHPSASVSAVRQSIDISRLPWIRRLAVDYAQRFDQLAPFFAGNPADVHAWEASVVRAQAHPRRRSEAAALVAAQQRRRGAPPEAVAAAGRLADPRTVAIVTGQQAGLFGGPMFTLLKALTALKLADETARTCRVPTVAVFWVEAEDHDWDEVSTCAVLDADLQRRTVALGRPSGAGEIPVAAVRLDQSTAAAVDALEALLEPTEFTAMLFARLRRAYRPGSGMADAFGCWMETVLGDRGLVVFDASDPAAKPLMADLFAREFEEPGRSSTLAARAGQELVGRGYHSQVVPHLDSISLFHLDGGRHPIRVQGGTVRAGAVTRAAADWAREAAEHPERFSPNVLLRPVVQDTVFPTVCYVSGPNELAYQAQLGPVYGHFGVPMPLFFPRATVTLLDSAGAKFLDRYAIAFESLQADDEAVLNRLLEAQLPASVERALQQASRAIEGAMESVITEVPAIDPTLEGAARSTLGKMQHELQSLNAKTIQAAKKRDEILRRQFRRTRALAFPDSHPQERAIGHVYFLNRYGPALVDRLVADLPLDMGRHFVVTI